MKQDMKRDVEQDVKPIGYWLNRTDQALTASMDSALVAFGLTRLGWQVLNAVRDDARATDAGLATALAVGDGTSALSATVAALLADGRLTRPRPDRLALTDDGRALLAEAARRMGAFRERSARGITREEYLTAVSVLERMTRNAEAGPER
ncbi:MarR family winged helix-turn-helix transcriptional regulator [Streptomyces sp. NPDC090046]|uniref:MarR family winged helix-turn-helix transcriptional regulator n=1 Tax=Streptomyces sp. NPDC090046 TaxID=3365928 RepID=UPI0038039E50